MRGHGSSWSLLLSKEWNAGKRAIVLPTLLRGKLLDIYIELGEDTRADLAEVKKILMSKAGLTKDLVSRSQTSIFSAGRYRLQYKRPHSKRVWYGSLGRLVLDT